MGQVAVIILNWNGKSFLEKFLPDVVRYSDNIAHVYVADNASTDDSVQFLRTNFPSVSIIINPKNGGFAEGYNMAIREIKEEYCVFLNSDVQVTPHWLIQPLEIMKQDAKVAAVQPKIKSFASPGYFEYAGAAGGFIDSLGYPFCRGRMFDTMEKDEGQYNVQSEIFWASGACLFIRTALFREMNGFDEDLFSHQEEIDLCWRLKSTGYKIMYCPASEVMHFGGGMLPKTNPHKTFLNFRNNLIIICKNYKGAKMGQVLFIRFILDILAAFRYLFIGNTGDFCAVIKAQWQFTTGIPKTLKKRHLLNNSPNALISCIYKHSIVRKYFIQHIRKFSLLDKREFTG